MEDVLEVSRKIWDALAKDDTEVLKKYIHEDAMFVHMGVTLKRDEEIDYMQKGIIVPLNVDFEESNIKDFGSSIVLLNKVKVTALVHGKEAINPFVVTEVYQNQEDGLQLISWAYTKITY